VNYAEFVSEKLAAAAPVGIQDELHLADGLFPHQVDLVRWALKRGRAAIFADTGLGKTRMQLAWADAVHRKTGQSVLILAPLAVSAQTVAEGEEIGIKVTHLRSDWELTPGINITNYERLHKINPAWFGGVVLDESSIIKHHDAKTFSILTEAFRNTPYKLCATATPAPNDWTELGTHAEFLGIRQRQEMLAEFFTHDGGDTQTWRLKGHARQIFWQWVVSWGALIRRPSDLGHDDTAYKLPPLHLHEHHVSVEMPTNGMLFALEAQTLSERRDARRASLADRVAECAAIVNADNDPWIVWCDLNAEGDALRHAIPGAVEIRGSDTPEDKERRLIDFAQGRIRVLITKPSIAGFGLNWQHCNRMAFVGVTDSFESYYQAVRRCWRFGQKREVHVHIFASDAEGAIVANLKRKERDAMAMAESLSAETRDAVFSEVRGASRESNEYAPGRKIQVPSFLRVA
jgi:superfamily II DNA or RNA helicase